MRKLGGKKNPRMNKATKHEFQWSRYLTTETVEGASLTLESVDDVEGGDGLSLGVFTVCHNVRACCFDIVVKLH